MRRIAALVVAIGLIVGALIIRNHRDTEKARGPYRLTCATEFADACHTLPAADVTVTIEPAGVTADRLIALAPDADPGLDGWLAAGNWDLIYAQARQAQGKDFVSDPVVLGHTRVAVAAWRDRLNVLVKACAPLTWRCLGDAAAKVSWKASGGLDTWGPLKIALADPYNETSGLASIAAAATSFTTMALGGDPADNDVYLRWLRAVAKASPQPAPELAAILATGPAIADLYIGLEAQIGDVLRTSARRADIEVAYLAPAVDVEAKLLPFARKAPKGLAQALLQAGWTQRATTGTVPSNLAAGLRTLWKDTVR